MDSGDIWKIASLQMVVAVGPVYGYWVGNAAKRRSWRYRKIKKVAAIPMLATAGLVLAAGISTGKLFAPWFGAMACGPILAMVVALRIARPGVGLAGPDDEEPHAPAKNKLSIV